MRISKEERKKRKKKGLSNASFLSFSLPCSFLLCLSSLIFLILPFFKEKKHHFIFFCLFSISFLLVLIFFCLDSLIRFCTFSLKFHQILFYVIIPQHFPLIIHTFEQYHQHAFVFDFCLLWKKKILKKFWFFFQFFLVFLSVFFLFSLIFSIVFWFFFFLPWKNKILKISKNRWSICFLSVSSVFF